MVDYVSNRVPLPIGSAAPVGDVSGVRFVNVALDMYNWERHSVIVYWVRFYGPTGQDMTDLNRSRRS
jgi:hypothetical protein